jgi:hypothetical protein
MSAGLAVGLLAGLAVGVLAVVAVVIVVSWFRSFWRWLPFVMEYQ